ncbi:hypothetical protein [Nostoc sp. MG11]|uniref:hypothetical protein n=1 Tax=Nostoc sp. MG11 TaxID=2721166 RepID=UPI001866004E|nr:hypothetical protein [Nostoc sp. MG11]
MLRPGQNSTSFTPAWNHGKTQTIRVPITLAAKILEYARAIDSGLELDQQLILRAIDQFVEMRIAEFHPNQYSRTGSTNSRRWDELRKFRDVVAHGPLDHAADGLVSQSQQAIAHR